MRNIKQMYTISWSKKAQKQLLKISRPAGVVIYDKVDNLKHFPGCQNVKALKKHKHDYRLRVGNYRVFFNHDSSIKIVSIATRPNCFGKSRRVRITKMINCTPCWPIRSKKLQNNALRIFDFKLLLIEYRNKPEID